MACSQRMEYTALRIICNFDVPIVGIHFDMGVELANIVNTAFVIGDKCPTDISSMCVFLLLVEKDKVEKALVAACSFQDPLRHPDDLPHRGYIVGTQPVEQHPGELIQFISCFRSQSLFVHL